MFRSLLKEEPERIGPSPIFLISPKPCFCKIGPKSRWGTGISWHDGCKALAQTWPNFLSEVHVDSMSICVACVCSFLYFRAAFRFGTAISYLPNMACLTLLTLLTLFLIITVEPMTIAVRVPREDNFLTTTFSSCTFKRTYWLNLTCFT